MIRTSYQSSNSHICVIGSNSGMGRALIPFLLQAGSYVIGSDIQEHSDIESSKFQYFSMNPTSEKEINSFSHQLEEKDIALTGLVCLSGTILNFKKIANLSYDEWLEEYDISFRSCFNACKALMPLLKKANNASIVNMSSGLAFGGQLNYGAYTTAKASIVSFTKTLATELAPKIRVNSVAPGAVDTPFIYQKDGSTRFDPEMYKSITPLGTIATSEEIAQVILFLLSEGASHITGQCIHVNGGAMMV